MRLAIFAIVVGILGAASAEAQAFNLGTPTDPCIGGTAMTTAAGATLRFGDYSCTFSVPAEGMYVVTLLFAEPCFLAGACAGGQVSVPGGRIFNVSINDTQVLTNFDPVAAGATDTSIAVRRFAVYSAVLKFTIKLQTVKRSALLYSIVFGPNPLVLAAGN